MVKVYHRNEIIFTAHAKLEKQQLCKYQQIILFLQKRNKIKNNLKITTMVWSHDEII